MNRRPVDWDKENPIGQARLSQTLEHAREQSGILVEQIGGKQDTNKNERHFMCIARFITPKTFSKTFGLILQVQLLLLRLPRLGPRLDNAYEQHSQ